MGSSKLTLSVDKRVVEQAKSYARSHNTSVSKLIERYLASLTDSKENEIEVTPFVKSLGIDSGLPADYDSKGDYVAYLIEKYK